MNTPRSCATSTDSTGSVLIRFSQDAEIPSEISRSSQDMLAESIGNTSRQEIQLVQQVDSECMLRDLRNQSFSRETPICSFLIGTPVNAKEIRTHLDSLDNAIVTPQIINGKVYFPTHTEADTRTAVEGSASNPNLNESHSSGAPAPRGVDLHKVKFTFAQLVKLLGQSTCQRLEREFVKQNQLSEVELSQLRTARESISLDSIRTAQSVEPNLLSTRTAQSVEPNLLSVCSARSPGTFTKNEGVLTAQSPEPNMLSTRTAQSVEPNLLSVYSARDLTTMSQLKARSPGVLTAQPLEPNLLSTRTARSSSSGSSLHGDESTDVQTCLEIEEAPETGVNTARSFATPSGSTQSVLTAREIETIRSSQDVRTAVKILSEMSRSSQDVTTALEIQDDATQMTI